MGWETVDICFGPFCPARICCSTFLASFSFCTAHHLFLLRPPGTRAFIACTTQDLTSASLVSPLRPFAQQLRLRREPIKEPDKLSSCSTSSCSCQELSIVPVPRNPCAARYSSHLLPSRGRVIWWLRSTIAGSFESSLLAATTIFTPWRVQSTACQT